MKDVILRSADLDKRILDYVLTVTERDPWGENIVPGRHGKYSERMKDFRARYDAVRSVAQLYEDAKNEPFPLSSNLGVGIEQIFGERLIPTFLANSIDLEPHCQALDRETGKPVDELTDFHEHYHKVDHKTRIKLELSDREMLTVGSSVHKWVWSSLWRHTEDKVAVFVDPTTRAPILQPDPNTGELSPLPVDYNMPEENYPIDPMTGKRLMVAMIPAVNIELQREGPQLCLRSMDQFRFPKNVASPDFNDWDWYSEDYEVTPWWFLGREGDPFQGKFQNLNLLWKWLKLDPAEVHKFPNQVLTRPVKLREFYGKFPATKTGKPIEIIALVALEPRILLAWRVLPFPRRPHFNRQVWSRKGHPLGKGIPETVWSLRGAMDAILNQDMDSGNLYNHPPLLLAEAAMIDDEDYEAVGPGSRWVMSDINGAKFLPPPVGKRDAIMMLNWLISMTQRLWGVTDINLNAPTNSLSPNVKTATGAAIVQSEGNIKFGHLTKRLEGVRTEELQFVHELFGKMLANPKIVPVKGQPMKVDRNFFRRSVDIRAAGDGVTTNPTLKQQVYSSAYQMLLASQNPFIVQDLETYHELTEQLIKALGLKINIKPAQEVQEIAMIKELMATPQGQMHIQAAIQEIKMAQQMQQQMQQMKQMQAMQGGQNAPQPV